MPTPPTPLQITYVDPDDNVWNLSDTSLQKGYVCTGIAGIEGLPTALQLITMLDGTARSDLFMAQPGTITLGLFVTRPASDSENDYYGLLDDVVQAFYNRRDTAPSPGYIQIQRPDGTTRQIAVYTTSGLNTPEVAVSNGTIYTFTLQTPDPFWYDLTSTELTFSNPGIASGILPLLPISLQSSQIIGTNTVTNNGGTDTYPEWLIVGPGTPTITNLTTGRAFGLSSPVASGTTVDIKTKPGQQQCVDITHGLNLWGQLAISTPRDLWALVPGQNQISISMAGATAASQVNMVWNNRWLRA
jgi:phage-related protein